MDDTIGVEVGEGQGYVMAEIHLSVVAECFVHCKNIWVTSTIFWSSQLHACCVSETLAMNFIKGFLQFESKCS